MKKYLKENIKSLPFIIITFVMLYSITTFASEYLFNSNEVQYDNSTSGIRSSNVQDAIDELYTAANNYSAYDSRLTALESLIPNSVGYIGNTILEKENINYNYSYTALQNCWIYIFCNSLSRSGIIAKIDNNTVFRFFTYANGTGDEDGKIFPLKKGQTLSIEKNEAWPQFVSIIIYENLL